MGEKSAAGNANWRDDSTAQRSSPALRLFRYLSLASLTVSISITDWKISRANSRAVFVD